MTRTDGIAVATHAARSTIGVAPDGDFQRWVGLDRFAAFASEAGFDGVDASTSVWSVDRGLEWWRSLQTSLAHDGLELASINCLRSSVADEQYGELGSHRIRGAVRIARELGIPSVNISLAVPPERLDANEHRQLARPPGSSLVASPEERDRTLRVLNDIADEAGADGPELVLELHHCSVVDTASALAETLGSLGGRYAANADLVNELWAFEEIETDWRESLASLAPLSGAIWHVKNFTLEGRTFVDAPLDDGFIDYRSATRMMRDAGFHGWISIERSGDGDFLSTSARGLAFLRSLDTPHQQRSTR
jgi:sugar phosphate isomerase/epimerase